MYFSLVRLFLLVPRFTGYVVPFTLVLSVVNEIEVSQPKTFENIKLFVNAFLLTNLHQTW